MRPLKIVLMDGEFYKKENRIEYTDAFSNFQRTPESIRILDQRLAPGGDFGQAWIEAKNDISSFAQKKKKLAVIANGVETASDAIIKEVIASLRIIVEVTNGILHGEVGGRYDSLANFGYIDGKNNANFRQALGKSKDMLERMLVMIRDLSEIETSERIKGTATDDRI